MLFRDPQVRANHAEFVNRHIATVRRAHAGEEDLPALHADKLIRTLVAAADSRQFGSVLTGWRNEETVVRARADE